MDRGMDQRLGGPAFLVPRFLLVRLMTGFLRGLRMISVEAFKTT